jgi:phenylpropionate dioxygenase-like ring-hydroxylating dioxygenase large terminal subunit
MRKSTMPPALHPSDQLNRSSHLDDPLLFQQWFAIAWSREVLPGKPFARHIMGRDVVLWRSSNALHCWRDLCIHRGAKLSLGTIKHGENGECLVCPYHAWHYAPTGQCILIPAHPTQLPPPKARVETYQVRERYGVIWVCLGDPVSDIPDFPYAEDPAFRTILAGPYLFRANGPRVIENLFDIAHLGYVHAGLLGDPQHLEIEDYEVTESPHGPEAKSIRIWQPDPDGTGNSALVDYHYFARGPLTAGLVKLHADKRFGILAQVVPIDDDTCETRLIMVLDYGHEVPEADLLRFQDEVTAQDKIVVESQRPELLPLDLQAELHLRSDRMAIAYRKWLRSIGFTYGTA